MAQPPHNGDLGHRRTERGRYRLESAQRGRHHPEYDFGGRYFRERGGRGEHYDDFFREGGIHRMQKKWGDKELVNLTFDKIQCN